MADNVPADDEPALSRVSTACDGRLLPRMVIDLDKAYRTRKEVEVGELPARLDTDTEPPAGWFYWVDARRVSIHRFPARGRFPPESADNIDNYDFLRFEKTAPPGYFFLQSPGNVSLMRVPTEMEDFNWERILRDPAFLPETNESGDDDDGDYGNGNGDENNEMSEDSDDDGEENSNENNEISFVDDKAGENTRDKSSDDDASNKAQGNALAENSSNEADDEESSMEVDDEKESSYKASSSDEE